MKVNYKRIGNSKAPQEKDGLAIKYDKAKRSSHIKRWYMLLVIVSTPIVLICWIILRPYVFVLAPGITTTEPLEIRSHAKGTVSEILIIPGKTIAAGTPIIKIEDHSVTNKVDEYERQLIELGSNFLAYNQAILDVMAKKISIAKNGEDRELILLETYEKFQKKGIVPVSEMALVTHALTATKLLHQQAITDLSREEERQRSEILAGPVAQKRNSILLELANLEAEKEFLVVKSPVKSKVVEIFAKEGENISAGQPLALLTGRSDPVILVFLNPKYLKYAAIGQEATVKLPNRKKIRAKIKEPTEMVSKIPTQLSGPFDGERSALKITLTPITDMPSFIEGLPVEVSFDYVW